MDTDIRVKKVLSKALVVDDSLVIDKALLADDLGISSVDRFELLMDLEDEFGIEVIEEDLDGVKTVADVVQRVEWMTKRQEHRH
jgi:acyl carrier protein